jgi:hypothetical protein
MLSDHEQSAMRLANKAFVQILQFDNNRQITAPKTAPPDGSLYHYTNAEGLKGIIENNELWATSAYFLNDSAEITYGYGVLKEALDNWIADNPLQDNSLALAFAQDFRKSFGEDLLNMDIIKLIYLACFCEHDNLLSQWRTYGQSGGYSVGFKFSSSMFVEGCKAEPNSYSAVWTKVIYDRTDQLNKCRDILDAVLPIFNDDEIAEAVRFVDSHPTMANSGIRKVLEDMLVEEIVAFKNVAFRDEREWRIVVRQRESVKQAADDGGKAPTVIHFRVSRGALVPFVKLIPSDDGGKLPIACLRIGPSIDKTPAVMALSLMLAKNGYGNAFVEGSDIPVRL